MIPKICRIERRINENTPLRDNAGRAGFAAGRENGA